METFTIYIKTGYLSHFFITMHPFLRIFLKTVNYFAKLKNYLTLSIFSVKMTFVRYFFKRINYDRVLQRKWVQTVPL